MKFLCQLPAFGSISRTRKDIKQRTATRFVVTDVVEFRIRESIEMDQYDCDRFKFIASRNDEFDATCDITGTQVTTPVVLVAS